MIEKIHDTEAEVLKVLEGLAKQAREQIKEALVVAYNDSRFESEQEKSDSLNNSADTILLDSQHLLEESMIANIKFIEHLYFMTKGNFEHPEEDAYSEETQSVVKELIANLEADHGGNVLRSRFTNQTLPQDTAQKIYDTLLTNYQIQPTTYRRKYEVGYTKPKAAQV